MGYEDMMLDFFELAALAVGLVRGYRCLWGIREWNGGIPLSMILSDPLPLNRRLPG